MGYPWSGPTPTFFSGTGVTLGDSGRGPRGPTGSGPGLVLVLPPPPA